MNSQFIQKQESQNRDLDLIVKKNIFKIAKEKFLKVHNYIISNKNNIDSNVVLFQDKIPDILIKNNSKIYRKFKNIMIIFAMFSLLNFTSLFIVNEDEFRNLHTFLFVLLLLYSFPIISYIFPSFLFNKKACLKEHLNFFDLANILNESSEHLSQDEINTIKQILNLPSKDQKLDFNSFIKLENKFNKQKMFSKQEMNLYNTRILDRLKINLNSIEN